MSKTGLYLILAGGAFATAYFLAKRKNKKAEAIQTSIEEESPSFEALNKTIKEIEN